MNKGIAALLLLLLVPLHAGARESCALESIGLTAASPLPERLFYTGTCHYRNADYPEAVRAWIQLANLKQVAPKFEELQISVLNNLGYMLFFGYGISEDKQKAVSYWQKAVSLGHIESEYHLCHAYADRGMPTYHRARALAHCKKAQVLYQGGAARGEDDKVILKDINDYLGQLGS